MDKYFLSVIICTYNRDNYLVKLLDSLIKQTLNQENFEIIFIDNMSTDKTKEISDKYQHKFNNYTYHYEDKAGLSHARNTGIELSRGNVLVYIDDDATASEKWLESIYTVFKESNITPAVLGGPILPKWEKERPKWYPDELFAYISCVNMGEEEKIIPYTRIYGCNMAILKEKLIKYGSFHPELGRVKNQQFTHEERLLFFNFQKNNEIIYYHPEMLVYHFVPVERSTYQFLINRAYSSGKSGAILDSISQHRHKDIPQLFLRDLFFTILSIIGLKEKKYFFMCTVRIVYFVSYCVFSLKLVTTKLLKRF